MKKRDQKMKEKNEIADEQLAAILEKIKDTTKQDYEEVDYSDNEEGEFEVDDMEEQGED